MKKLSTSSNKFERRHKLYTDKLNAGEISLDRFKEINQMDKDLSINKLSREEQPEFQKDNLEYDLRSTDWILEKARTSGAYAQNLYAALCNNDFCKNVVDDTPENILKILAEGKKYWSCSWRYAGGIVADMRGEGDYLDWYCSGIRNADYDEDVNAEWDGRGYVGEGVVTDEIVADLKKLGWLVSDVPDLE